MNHCRIFFCLLLISGSASAQDIFRAPQPKDVPELIKAFSSGHDPRSRSAVRAVARVGKPAIPALLKVL